MYSWQCISCITIRVSSSFNFNIAFNLSSFSFLSSLYSKGSKKDKNSVPSHFLLHSSLTFFSVFHFSLHLFTFHTWLITMSFSPLFFFFCLFFFFPQRIITDIIYVLLSSFVPSSLTIFPFQENRICFLSSNLVFPSEFCSKNSVLSSQFPFSNFLLRT